MIEGIPNEILSEILFHALTIPAAVFEARSTPYTFAATPPSTAPSIPCVSSRWYALGVPALYEAAVFNTGVQCDGYLRALGSAGPHGGAGDVWRGRYLRRLRVHGGYSRLARVLRAARGVEVLFLSGEPPWQESVRGLTRALRGISPVRLVLKGVWPGGTSSTRSERA